MGLKAVDASPRLSTLRTLGAVVCPKLLMTGGSQVERGYPGMVNVQAYPVQSHQMHLFFEACVMVLDI